ncbi:MAG TPA: 2,3-diphosphoglycerate-dependent phosphoglycerate mutase [Acidimicrobiales bacterium]|nr:2,3-diphosphoglycerate-dependent phosphoglycerate mutase [Acidimicrobiales bacterium]
MGRLVLLRHGQSTWNLENVFTGWQECGLSPRGLEEAKQAGRLLAEAGVEVDLAHTSLQNRAIATANLALEALDRAWVPVRRHWRLNERHYGDLETRNKAETAALHSAEQVQIWRRSYDVPPPPIALDDLRHPSHNPRYRHVAPDVLPAGECLRDVVVRMLPYWYDAIVPDLASGATVLVAAHGNSLRGLVKHLKGIADADIPALEIPTGVPWVFELGDDLGVVKDGLLA